MYLDDFQSDRHSLITKVAESKSALTIEQQISSKIEITLAELTQKTRGKVSLSQECQEFKHKHQKTISETLKSHKLPQSTLKFIQKSCGDRIKVEKQSKGHYLSLKSI